MSDYITTYSKIHFTPLSPKEEEICIQDIAHALSLMTRANGHFPRFYSVGQHCIHCCQEAAARGYSSRVQLSCLLHDAGEAYLSDITRPVKGRMPDYRRMEQKLLDAIFQKYLGGLSQEEQELWRRLDDTLLYYEFDHFMGEQLMEDPEPLASHPVFETEPFTQTEEQYLQLFRQLSRDIKGGEL